MLIRLIIHSLPEDSPRNKNKEQRRFQTITDIPKVFFPFPLFSCSIRGVSLDIIRVPGRNKVLNKVGTTEQTGDLVIGLTQQQRRRGGSYPQGEPPGIRNECNLPKANPASFRNQSSSEYSMRFQTIYLAGSPFGRLFAPQTGRLIRLAADKCRPYETAAE
jgi:hypothetical protein